MCEVNLVKVRCVSKVFFSVINNHKKISQSNYFQNKGCSITSSISVMCEVNLVKVRCYSKVINFVS